MKSNVSDFLDLMEAIYIDATMKCSADVSDLRDLNTIRSRVNHEGLSFLTITLPTFCRDLERTLHNGRVNATLFARWKSAKGAVMPAFLQGFTRHMIDFETGKVICHEVPPYDGGISDDIPTILDSVRQICLTFKKVEIGCTPEREESAFENFVTIEQTLSSFQLRDEDADKFLSVSSVLWRDMVADFSVTDIVPRHGPGATSERISGNSKYRWKYWHDRLEPYFPLVGSAYPMGISDQLEELNEVSVLPESEELPLRVVSVPKTLKSPRIIAIEPCCMQYAQQGIRDYLYSRLESWWLTKGHVNFRDQSINQTLAISSSRDGRLATIDLSDASDRVPRDLAMRMFEYNQDLHDSILACRSTKAQLPNGVFLDSINKFASMGSALCFPVEAMYFYTICVVALLESMHLSVNARNVYFVTRSLYVYGDDIIVPSAYADSVLEHLQKYNCKVNTHKSFWTGKFRESCGVDAYNGEQVTPVYLRKVRPKNRRMAHELVSWCATANLFYRKGYWRTTTHMRNCIEKVVGPLPYVSETSPGLGHFSFLGYCSASRWNINLQRLEVKALVPEPKRRTDVLGSYGALMRFFLESHHSAGDDVLTERSLKHSALRGSVTLKSRWIRAS